VAKKELLDQKAIHQRGCFERVERWWRGIHPGKGTITRGWTGWETVEQVDRILPAHTFAVRNRSARS
jgi:hypothetical protein